MPFGLCNAPSIFQRFIETVLHDILYKLKLMVKAYLDDVLNSEALFQKHRINNIKILMEFEHWGITLNLKKCHFEQRQIDYLGTHYSKGNQEPQSLKLKVLKNWPRSKNVKDIQRFIGFVNFYRRFIGGFAKIAKPLHKLTQKLNPWKWTHEEENSMQELIKKLCEKPLLGQPNPYYPFLLETDASNFAVGAVLSQKSTEDNKTIRPIGFFSKTLSSAQQNWYIVEKEAYALVIALENW